MRGGAKIKMNTKLLVAGAMFLTSSVAIAAQSINLHKAIQWNSTIVEQALEKTFQNHPKGHLICISLEKPLAIGFKYKFSLNNATQVCVEESSRFPTYDPGIYCPKLIDNLIDINNSYEGTGLNGLKKAGLATQQGDLIKIFSSDKLFYALSKPGTSSIHQVPSLKKYIDICAPSSSKVHTVNAVIFTNKGKAIGLLVDAGHLATSCTIAGYENYVFEMNEYKGLKYTQNSTKTNNISLFARYREGAHAAPRLIQTIHEVLSDKNLLTEKTIVDLQRKEQNLNAALSAWENMQLSHSEYLKDPSILDRFNNNPNNRVLINKGLSSELNNIKRCLNSFKQQPRNDVQTFKNKQTPKEGDAYLAAKNHMLTYAKACPKLIDPTKIICSGDCNPLPGTDDTVTCTIGSITKKYLFNDICD